MMIKPPAFKSQERADEWLDRLELFQRAMSTPRQVWLAEDKTVIGYNTASMDGGGFCSFRYRATGDGGVPTELVFVKRHAQRKAARARAVALYRKYAPKWANRHGAFE